MADSVSITVTQINDILSVGITEEIDLVTVEVSEVGVKGDKGDKGDTGDEGPQGPSGDANLFIQEAQPTLDKNLIWFELRSDKTLKSVWVNTI